MKTQDIKNMGLAYFQVLEAMKKKKMDPVDADELKGSHADRSDKDIDNDGDADKSDEYLHNRRKAIKATITKEEVEEMDEAKKMSISAKAIKNALASAKAQAKPKDQVSLKKAPFDIPKESVVVESVYSRVIEARGAADKNNKHNRTSTEPESWDEKEKNNKGAMDMRKQHAPVIPTIVNEPEIDIKTFANMTAKVPTGKSRPGDNKTGDRKIVNQVSDISKKASAKEDDGFKTSRAPMLAPKS